MTAVNDPNHPNDPKHPEFCARCGYVSSSPRFCSNGVPAAESYQHVHQGVPIEECAGYEPDGGLAFCGFPMDAEEIDVLRAKVDRLEPRYHAMFEALNLLMSGTVDLELGTEEGEEQAVVRNVLAGIQALRERYERAASMSMTIDNTVFDFEVKEPLDPAIVPIGTSSADVVASADRVETLADPEPRPWMQEMWNRNRSPFAASQDRRAVDRRDLTIFVDFATDAQLDALLRVAEGERTDAARDAELRAAVDGMVAAARRFAAARPCTREYLSAIDALRKAVQS